MSNNQRIAIGLALSELIAAAMDTKPKTRIGLMMSGSELGSTECLQAAAMAMADNPRLQVVGIGPRTKNELDEGDIEWLETAACDYDIAKAMEHALKTGSISGAVAMHYPFPVGVATIGRMITPGRGRPMFIASCTGTTATNRIEAMVRNAILGIAVAKSMGIKKPTIGILNVENAPTVQKLLMQLKDNGYELFFGNSTRSDGGVLLRGNDILNGSVDICVCDTLTGNTLMKIFGAYTTGGNYEMQGWGYGPSVGAGWNQIVSIVSRASGAPVIANALQYTARVVEAGLCDIVSQELAAANKADLSEICASAAPRTMSTAKAVKPSAVPVDSEIHGIDVLDLDEAVNALWAADIYAEAAMGCTGPVIKLSAKEHSRAMHILRDAGYC